MKNIYKNKKTDKIFFIHLIVSLIFNLSFLLFSWKIILLGILIYYLQIIILGNCIFTIIQFKSNSKNNSWYHFLLSKIGLKLNRKRVNFFIIYIKPWIILILSIILQLVIKIEPLLT